VGECTGNQVGRHGRNLQNLAEEGYLNEGTHPNKGDISEQRGHVQTKGTYPNRGDISEQREIYPNRGDISE
jgi:hypothetical protein